MNRPLTFELDGELFERLEAFRERTGSRSTSAIIRAAVAEFDFDHPKASPAESKQISIRMDAPMRDRIEEAAKEQGVSIGAVLRKCLLAFLEKDEHTPHPPVGKQPLPMRQDVVRDDAEQNQKAFKNRHPNSRFPFDQWTAKPQNSTPAVPTPCQRTTAE